MTRQEAFNSIVEHLAAQGGPAIDEAGACFYRGPCGRKCAVGFLIPDDKYTSDLEGLSPHHEKFKNLPEIYHDHDFFRGLQAAHDNASRSGVNGTSVWADVWDRHGIAGRLEVFAQENGLDAAALYRAFGERGEGEQ